MAAFEVLSLDPAVPQIRAPGAGDTYSVPREMVVSVNTATDALRITQTGAGNALVVEDSANPDSSPFVVTAAGDVGVGLTAPLAKTNVAAGASLSLAEQTYTGDALFIGGTGITAGINTYGSGVTWSRLGANGRRRAAISSVQTTADEDQVGLAFFTHPSTGLTVDIAESMRLDHNGNVGIGTTSPAAKTEILTTDATVYSTSTAQGGTGGLLVSNQLNNNNNIAQITFRQRNVSTYDTSIGASGGSANFLFFKTNGAERMRLDVSGNLGIGTTAPQAVLDLGSGSSGRGLTWGGTTGTARYASIFTSVSAANIVLGYGFHGSSSTDTYLSSWTGTAANAGVRVGTGTVLFFTDTATAQTAGNAFTPTERMRITSAGDVGIGTASPGQKLEVAGNVRLSGSQVGSKIENQITAISVTTSATTILDVAGSYGRLVVVNGGSGSDRFCDLVLASTAVAPTVVSSFTASGSPAARTYTRSGVALQLAMASGTYSVWALALGY